MMAVVEPDTRQLVYSRLDSSTAKLLYCSLAAEHAASARELAGRLNEPLLTVWSVLRTLERKGVVRCRRGSEGRVYEAVPPSEQQGDGD